MPLLRWRFLLALCLIAACAPVLGAPPDEEEAMRCLVLRDNDPAAAIVMADEALKVPGTAPDVRVMLLSCLARSTAHARQTERAGQALAEIDELLAAHEFPPEFVLRALSNSGSALHLLGRYETAIDYYIRAYAVAQESESELAQVAMLTNIGSIYSEVLRAYAEAEVYFSRAAEMQARLGEQDAVLSYNRGENFRVQGRHGEALPLLQFAETAAEADDYGVVMQRARASRIAVEAELGGGFTPEVLTALREVARDQEALQDTGGVAGTLLLASTGALRAGRAEEALAHARSVLALPAKALTGTDRRPALEAELAALKALGQWRQALSVAEALRELEAPQLQAGGLDRLASLQAKLEDTRQAEELRDLREQRRLEAQRLEHEGRMRRAVLGAIIALAILAALFIWYQRRITLRLRQLSSVDGLTGLLNRRAASGELQRGGALHDGDRRGVVFLIDIDHFKTLNDRHGHAAGDTVLRAVARQLRASSRPGDIVARWGGEEFLVGCRSLDKADACAVAERLRAAIAGIQLPDTAIADQRLSVSIGFACHPFFPLQSGPDDWEDAVALADRALYAAKHGGRDAWVGLWGDAERQHPIDTILADPAHHAGAGDLDVSASRQPVIWQPVPTTGTPGPG